MSVQKACMIHSCLSYAEQGGARCSRHAIVKQGGASKKRRAATVKGGGAQRRHRAMVNSVGSAHCARCGVAYPATHIEIDHVLPLANGGADVDVNVQTLCRTCHRSKTRAESIARNRKPRS